MGNVPLCTCAIPEGLCNDNVNRMIELAQGMRASTPERAALTHVEILAAYATYLNACAAAGKPAMPLAQFADDMRRTGSVVVQASAPATTPAVNVATTKPKQTTSTPHTSMLQAYIEYIQQCNRDNAPIITLDEFCAHKAYAAGEVWNQTENVQERTFRRERVCTDASAAGYPDFWVIANELDEDKYQDEYRAGIHFDTAPESGPVGGRHHLYPYNGVAASAAAPASTPVDSSSSYDPLTPEAIVEKRKEFQSRYKSGKSVAAPSIVVNRSMIHHNVDDLIEESMRATEEPDEDAIDFVHMN